MKLHHAITIRRCICDDALDTAHYGKELGTEFVCGEGLHEVEVYIPDDPAQKVSLHFRDADRLSLPEMDATRILLNDPVVQAAIACKQAGLLPVPAGTIRVERHSIHDGEREYCWTDYSCGSVLLGLHEATGQHELIIDGHDMSAFPVTQATLKGLIADLQTLLHDPRMQAALPTGEDAAQVCQGLGCPRCRGDLTLNLATLHYHCEQRGCHWAGLRPDLAALGDAMHLVVATIDDAPVLASRYLLDPIADPDCPPQGLLGWFSCTWQGETIGTSGELAISMPDAETGISDDLHEKHFAWLKAAMAVDLFPRLMTIARRYADQPWPVTSGSAT